MNKRFKKILLLILCLAMVLSSCMALASCGKKENAPEKPDTNVDLPNEEVTGEKVPELPDEKFGKDFVVLTYAPENFWVEKAESGDIVEYAMYMRNTTVEEKFGVKIKISQKTYDKIPSIVSDYHKAGDANAVDIVLSHMVFTSNIVLAGDATDMYTIPYINFDDEWWPETNKNDLTLNGQNYLAVSNMDLSSIGHTACMYFNKDLAETHNLGDIYGYVDKGEWTFDKLKSLVKGVYKDLNQNNRKDEQDLYGLRVGSYPMNSKLMWGMDNRIFTKDPVNGEMKCTFYSKKTDSILKSFIDFYDRTDGVYHNNGVDQYNTLAQKQTVFLTYNFYAMTNALRDVENWGILPLPKYNEKQENYMTMVDGSMSALLVPKVGGDKEKYEKIGAVVTDLSYLSYKDVMPVYYNKALKGKYSESPKEAQMIDLIMAGRYMDFGYVYLGFEGPITDFNQLIAGRNSNLASYWAGKKAKLNEKISQAYEAFGLTFEGFD